MFDWSPTQALATDNWLQQIRERIWLLYGQDIVRLLHDDTNTMTPAFDGADDPPL